MMLVAGAMPTMQKYTFPVPFKAAPYVTATHSMGQDFSGVACAAGYSATATMIMTQSDTAPTGMSFIAIGQWK